MQAVPASLHLGAVIYERYIVESLLGRGDFGNIFLVRDLRDKQKLFALAEVNNPVDQSEYRFAFDYISSTPLDRQELPSVQYVFNDEELKRSYVLMSYIEGQNLEILRSRQAEKRFPFPQVRALMAPVIDAVTHLHGRHPPVIHGNIHPTSIIVSRGDVVMLVMLLLVEEQHSTTPVTLPYCAPGYGATEQYTGVCDVRSDVYGLGATCYTLITGIVPPDALHRATQLSNGESDPLQSVSDVVPSLPASMAGAIKRAMAVNAYDRFSSAMQFWEAFVAPVDPSPLTVSASISSASSLPAAPVPEEFSAHRGVEYSASHPVGSGHVQENPVPALAPKPSISRFRRLGLVLTVLVLLVGLPISAGLWLKLPLMHPSLPTPAVAQPTAIPVATPLAVPSSVSFNYPTLANTYVGTIYDVAINVSTSISLNAIQQGQGGISGHITLGPNLQGGVFKGTVDAENHIWFIMADSQGKASLFFEGVIRSTTSLSGDYYLCDPTRSTDDGRCVRAPGGYGIWDVEVNS